MTRHPIADPAAQTGAFDQPSVREWLDALPAAGPGVFAAAFATRLNKPAWLTGSAARGIATRLRRKGYHHLSEPTNFLVSGSYGPLDDGEIDRARQRGDTLAIRLAARHSGQQKSLRCSVHPHRHRAEGLVTARDLWIRVGESGN